MENEMFINDAPTQCVCELSKNKNKFNAIKITAKISHALAIGSISCVPLSITLCGIPAVVACLGAACVAGIPAAIFINNIAKVMYKQVLKDEQATDYINYCIYKQNEKLGKRLRKANILTNKNKLLKDNLDELFRIRDSVVIKAEVAEDYYNYCFEDYDGNLNNLIKKRDIELAKYYSSIDYIDSHICKNINLYKNATNGEYDAKFNMILNLHKDVEAINEPFLTRDYVEKRKTVANAHQLEQETIMYGLN